MASRSYTHTGQRVPRTGHEDVMIPNTAGGFTYKVDDKELLERIMVLGTASNTYYSTAQKLTSDAIDAVNRIIGAGNGQLVVDVVRDIYETGRAPKQDPTFFVLALLTQSTVPIDVRKQALGLIASLRTFSQLYSVEEMRKQLGSGKKQFGRGMRNSILSLVKAHGGKRFAYQATKYRSRGGWSIDDFIKLAHVPSRELTPEGQAVLVYLIKGVEAFEIFVETLALTPEVTQVRDYLRAVEAVKVDTCSVATAIELVHKYNLPREVLNTKLLTDRLVWDALLFSTSVGEGGKVVRRVTMPITALIRNLGVMTQRGVFDDSTVTATVVAHILNESVLRAGRVHPVALLTAKLTYDLGHGLKGKLSWTVNREISNALEEGFYVAFRNVQGTGKRVLHAIDCSGSMTWAGSCGTSSLLTASQAVACLVMEAVRREDRYAKEMAAKGTPVDYVQDVMLFDTRGRMVTITPTDKLADVLRKIADGSHGGTDCAVPMLNALRDNKKYDLFIVYTDNETYYGSVHPSEALDRYNAAYPELNARLVVVATTPTTNTIGYCGGGWGGGYRDAFAPHRGVVNPGCLNIAGFDLNAPTLIRNFALGSLGTATSATESSGTDGDDFELVEADE